MRQFHARRAVAPFIAAAVALIQPAAVAPAGERLPVVLVSSSPAFDRACENYYRQGNDADVMPGIAREFCICLGAELDGLGEDALGFFARTYSEDLTAFIHEYSEGDAWMQESFRADKVCKEADYGSNEPPPAGDFPRRAGSWGGIVRSGPSQEFSRLAALAEGEPVTLLENTGVTHNDYPWFRIRYRGSREGYQWGGILCSVGDPVPELFETCP